MLESLINQGRIFQTKIRELRIKIFGTVVVFHCYYRMPEKNNWRQEDLYSLVVLEVLVHGCWLHCFWTCGKAQQYGGRAQ
jgi:hypothetical protein